MGKGKLDAIIKVGGHCADHQMVVVHISARGSQRHSDFIITGSTCQHAPGRKTAPAGAFDLHDTAGARQAATCPGLVFNQ
jgi:hypothetical protein